MTLANRSRRPVRTAAMITTAALGMWVLAGPSSPARAQAGLTTSASYISGTLTTPAAFGQTQALSATQIAAATTAVRNAIAGLNPSLTGAARAQAVNQALSQVAASQIAADGAGAIVPLIAAAVAAGVPAPQAVAPVLPAAISSGVPPSAAVDAVAQGSISVGGSPTQTTQAIVAAAAQAGVSGAAIGNGLGQAVVALRASVSAGNQISQAVANQANAGIGQTFNTAVTSNGFPQLSNGGQANLSTVTGIPTASFGQPQSLSAVDIGAIQAQVGAVLAAVDPSLTGAARTQAINQALSQVAAAVISNDGLAAIAPIINAAVAAGIPAPQSVAPILQATASLGVTASTAVRDIVVGSIAAGGSAAQITQAAIAAAPANGASNAAVGAGLGQAAAILSASSLAAVQISQIAPTQGPTGIGQAFTATVATASNTPQLANDGLLNLAIIAGPPTAVTSANLAATMNQQISAAQITAIQAAVGTALANVDPALTGQALTTAVTQALQAVASSQIAVSGTAAITPIINAAVTANVPPPEAVAALLPAATGAGISAPQAVAAIAVGAVSAGASPTQTAEAIIAVAAQGGTSSAAVGTGLGQAAATLSQASSSGAGNQIAQVVSNEGTVGTGQAFATSVVSTGGSQQLASAGQQNPNAVSLTGTTSTTSANSTLAVASTNNTSLNGASQQISAVGTTITCTTPSCN